MALARIISRSHACSQELALDLLARGYAVEIVSPDAIPDNLADLELRVDSTRVDRLTASVEVHNGERKASLEFLHHLKKPLADFERRTPAGTIAASAVQDRAVPGSEQPLNFSTEPGIEDVKQLEETQPSEAETKSAAVASLRCPAVNRPRLGPFELVSKTGARQIVLPDSSPLPMEAPPGYFAVEEPTIALPTVAQPRQATRRRTRSAGWFWRAAVTFAFVVLVAFVVGFGMHRAGKLADQNLGPAPAEKVAAASADLGLVSTFGPQKDAENISASASAPAATPPAVKSERTFGKRPKGLRRAEVAAGAAQRSTGNSLIARDTVVYLDERYKPASIAKSADHSARRHPRSRKHGGVVSASTVTYLNKPTPTTK